MEDPGFDRLMRFVLELRQSGVTDARVLAAMERTPRTHFAPAQFAAFALEDRALPLADGQQMTKPSTVGRVLCALDLKGGETVLEVGTGSGYQAAVIGAVARRVISLERRQALAAAARGRVGQLRAMHVYVHWADGAEGWRDEPAFDRIVINAAVAAPPPALAAQLSAGGVMAAGVDGRLVRWRKGADGALAASDAGPLDLAALEAGAAP
ncbi:MAG: rRNA adenine N-6-methyltransferase family protein [Hyphomonadaceae bacterium]|nr:rRNA adenine N-6-methyltransferase family protein [Hyphomonadaceae bacterium]